MQIHGHVRRWRSAAFALLMVAGTTAVARAETWRVDPSHSKVSFKIRHLMISNVEGRFTKFDASIQGDPCPTSPTGLAFCANSLSLLECSHGNWSARSCSSCSTSADLTSSCAP